MKRLIIPCTLVLALVAGLLTGCVSGTGVTQTVTEPGVSAEPPEGWHAMIEKISLWENGEEQFVAGENSPMSKFLFQTLHRLNLQAKCAIFEEDIEEIKGNDKVIEMTFRFPEDIVISQWIGNHYRTLENVKSALFILEDNLNEGLEAHILVGHEVEGRIGYSCWAINIKQGGKPELDKAWIQEINKLFGRAS